jgi:hypothetical protein
VHPSGPLAQFQPPAALPTHQELDGLRLFIRDTCRLHDLREVYARTSGDVLTRSGRIRARRLGPIVLWRRTSPREIVLKLAFLSARVGVLSDDSRPPLLRATRAYLGTGRVDLGEIFSAALSGQGSGRLGRPVGYIGDFSHVSFRAFLRQVARGVDEERKRGVPEEVRQAELQRHGQQRQRRAPTPFTEPHPWTEDRPVPLLRSARDFEVPPHQARQWARDGKLRVCRPEPPRPEDRGKIVRVAIPVVSENSAQL